VKVVGGFEISNFRIQRLVHFYTRFWSFSILNKEPATLLRLERRRAATSSALTRHAPRPRASRPRCPRHPPPKAMACSFPMHRAPRPGSPPGRAHATDHAVPARCGPRTTGPSAEPRRTRAGRGGRARTTLHLHGCVTGEVCV
jgi:hypothetical protein